MRHFERYSRYLGTWSKKRCINLCFGSCNYCTYQFCCCGHQTDNPVQTKSFNCQLWFLIFLYNQCVNLIFVEKIKYYARMELQKYNGRYWNINVEWCYNRSHGNSNSNNIIDIVCNNANHIRTVISNDDIHGDNPNAQSAHVGRGVRCRSHLGATSSYSCRLLAMPWKRVLEASRPEEVQKD